MKRRVGRLLIFVSLSCGSVGAYFLKARLDDRAHTNAMRIVRLVRFGAQIDTRFAEYFQERGLKERYHWSVGRMGWFDRRIPMTLRVASDAGTKQYSFWVRSNEKNVSPGDDKTTELINAVKAWARQKTPDYLKSKLP